MWNHARNVATKASGALWASLPAPDIQLRRRRQQTRAPATKIINPYREETTKTHLARGIQTSLEDRWAILGTTGSGKTTFAKQLIRRLQRAYPAVRTYILDNKHVGDFADVDAYITQDDGAPDALHVPGATMVWQAPHEDLREFNEWFRKIWEARQPAVV